MFATSCYKAIYVKVLFELFYLVFDPTCRISRNVGRLNKKIETVGLFVNNNY